MYYLLLFGFPRSIHVSILLDHNSFLQYSLFSIVKTVNYVIHHDKWGIIRLMRAMFYLFYFTVFNFILLHFTCSLYNGAVNTSDHIALNGTMINEVERIWKESVALFLLAVIVC